jgi:hypothetical protein
MAFGTAIRDAGETFLCHVRHKMPDLDPQSIAVASPGEADDAGGIRLSLFLYKISENPYQKNQCIDRIDPSRSSRPQQTLDLYYMLTAYPPEEIRDITERSFAMHEVLGSVMQALHDNPVLAGPALKGSLAGGGELRIIPAALGDEDACTIWPLCTKKPFQPSVCYQITPVSIDSVQPMRVQRVEVQKAAPTLRLTRIEG